jgi:hemerythrin
MSLFIWNDSYKTNITGIDAQHKHLVDLINSLYDAMSKGQGNKALGGILDELYKYTVVHFGDEERLMLKTGYPDYAAHKKIHDEFTARVVAMKRDFEAGKVSLSLQVATFLKEWLSGHILGTDKKYAPYLASRGIK